MVSMKALKCRTLGADMLLIRRQTHTYSAVLLVAYSVFRAVGRREQLAAVTRLR